jgi:ABC-type proline/glycine betaine transport system substrate-binding protein
MIHRLTHLAAAAAAAAALAAAVAAPAGAQTITISEPPCDSVPGCVNYAADTADATVAYLQKTYNDQVQPVISDTYCVAYYVVTGVHCP